MGPCLSGLHIGTSGWTYGDWAGRFYPADLPRSRWRQHYTAQFDTVELNASFYRWPGVRPFESWNRTLPPGFTMSVKASRWVSHGHRLRDPDGDWARRMVLAMRALGPHAGVLLVQLPGDFERDDERLEAFLAGISRHGGIPVAMELRHPSWDDDAVGAILDRHGAAYVVTHGEGLHTVLRTTAPFVYCRWHGPPELPLYTGSYSEADLQLWADRIRGWRSEGREVWGYFDNDTAAHAPANARRLLELLGGCPPGD